MSLAVSITAMAQLKVQRHLPAGFRSGQLPAAVKNMHTPIKHNSVQMDNGVPINNNQNRLTVAPHKAHQLSTTTVTEEVIGYTYYDLQTNAAISNRLTKNADGTMSASWTFSPNATSGYPDRGTGYNYYDPSSSALSKWYFTPDGTNGDFPNVRTETAYRTGFTNIGVTDGGKEMSIAHSSTAGHMLLNWRATKGTGAWTAMPNALGTGTNNDTWAKFAVSGEDVHAIWQGSGTTGTPTNGQDGPLYYNHSSDGGQTWPTLHQLIPQIDSNYYAGFGGDDYAIDARGNTIAIVCGGAATDIVLLKSTDNGVTWTKTIILQFPIPFFSYDTMFTYIDADNVVDTMTSGCGDAKVIIDNNNMCHVVYGAFRWYRDSTTAAGYYSPLWGTDGLMYWNETMGTDAAFSFAESQDFNNNGVIDVPADTTCSLPWGNYRGGVTGMPSLGIDAAGTIYVSYQALAENTDTAVWHQMHRHIYVTATPDNGNTWAYPIDIVPMAAAGGDGEFQEAAFAAMARTVDANAYIIYQRDNAPGTSLATAGTCDQINNNLNSSDIVFASVEAQTLVGMVKAQANDVFVGQNYPNPVNGLTNINISLKKASTINMEVTDLVGKVVYSQEFTAQSGSNTVTLKTNNWQAGVYFYTVTVDGQKVTKQMVIN